MEALPVQALVGGARVTVIFSTRGREHADSVLTRINRAGIIVIADHRDVSALSVHAIVIGAGIAVIAVYRLIDTTAI